MGRSRNAGGQMGQDRSWYLAGQGQLCSVLKVEYTTNCDMASTLHTAKIQKLAIILLRQVNVSFPGDSIDEVCQGTWGRIHYRRRICASDG